MADGVGHLNQTIYGVDKQMALDYTVDAVPAGLEEHYEAKDGKFVLVVANQPAPPVDHDAVEAKEKLKEFRATNIALKQRLEALEAGTATSAPNIDELVKNAVAANTQKLQQIEQERTTLQAQLEEVVLSEKVKEAALKHGVHETALTDIVNRAKNAFTVKDGKPLPKDNAVDADGQVLSPEAWIKSLAESAPHFFKPSSGSGARRPVGVSNGVDTSSMSLHQRMSLAYEKRTRK